MKHLKYILILALSSAMGTLQARYTISILGPASTSPLNIAAT